MALELPFVSIIVVNYNYGSFLAECLASVVEQTYPEIECIVVDNASTDDSVVVIEQFRDALAEDWKDRFAFHQMGSNQHQTLASIAGFRLSRGQFVIFLDADDMLLQRCVRVHLQAHLSARESIGLTCGDMLNLTGDTLVATTTPGLATFMLSSRGRRPNAFRPLSERIVPFETLLVEVDGLGDLLHFVDPDETAAWPWSATSAFCYRREAVELMFSYTPRIMGSTDAYLAHGIAALTGGVAIDLPLAAYRRHGSNIFSIDMPLRGFRAFDVAKEVDVLKNILSEILLCYLFNARGIAKRSVETTMFFEAVKRLTNLYDALPNSGRRVSSGFLHFMLENRKLLEDCFGAGVVKSIINANVGTLRDRVEILRRR